MEYKYSLLSAKEKEEILNCFFSEDNMKIDFSLTSEELQIVKKFKNPSVSLGYALQLLFLKNRGISIISLYTFIPDNIILYVADQIDCNPKYLSRYWMIKNTKFRHFKEICLIFNYTKYIQTTEIMRTAYNITMVTGNKINMINILIQELKNKKIIIPTLSQLEAVISNGIAKTNKFIYKEIIGQIKDMDQILSLLNIDENGISQYSKLRSLTVNVSSTGVKELLNVIKEIDTYGKTVDLSFLSEDKLRYFNLELQRSNKTRIERFHDEDKKCTYLTLFLYFKRRELVDMILEVTSNYAHKVMKRSRKKFQEYNFKNQKKYIDHANQLKIIIKNIFEIKDFASFKKYQETLIDLKKELDIQEDEPEDTDFLVKSHKNFSYIHEFLECIEFTSNTKPDFIKFLNFFKKEKNIKKFDTDISFFSAQWQRKIEKYNYSKKIIEIALLFSIKDYIRSGDIFVKESKKYNSFDSYLLKPEEVFNKEKGVEFLKQLKSDFKIPNKIEISTNNDEAQSTKNGFSSRIYNYFPKITLTEIIYEVNSWTNILENFRDLSKKSKEREKVLIATLLANGHNVGFSKMSISSSIDENVLKRTNEFYFSYDNLIEIQKSLVNYHHSLEITKNWGLGKSSSSDGMRLPITSKTIYADYNMHYNNRGGSIYRHISDQYSPYYVQMLEGRDSSHVLDGLLYHDTNLEIFDHSTDTAGYTEQMFALTYLLGFNFRPRIRNVEQQQLYAFETIETENVKLKKINEKIIMENYSEILRLVESIQCKKVKASLILQKINSYNRDNGIAKGLKEIGRILKTKYILEYFSNKELQKEVQRILNKGESINSVGRLIFFGKHGRLNESTIEKQLEKVSCLNILISILVVWNSRYLEKVYGVVKTEKWFDLERFKEVSPLGTDHINFLGKYIFENKKILTDDGLRPLKIETDN